MSTPLTIAALLVASTALAQEVEVSPQLHAGDEFQLTVVRIRENSSRLQQNGRSTTPVQVRVIEATPQRLVLEWIPGDTTFENPPVAQDPLLQGAARAMSGLSLRLALNAEGKLANVLNADEVTPKVKAAVDMLLREFANRVPQEQRARFQLMLSQALQPALLVTTLAREPEMYFGLNGITVTIGKPVVTQVAQPGPFGGSPIPASYSVLAASATPASAVFTTSTEYDSAALAQLTRSLVEKSGARVSAEDLAKIPPIQMGDEGKYVFDRKLGLMREVIVTRRSSAGANRRVDGWEIRLVSGPRR